MDAEKAIEIIRMAMKAADTTPREEAGEWVIDNPVIPNLRHWGMFKDEAERDYSRWLKALNQHIQRNPYNALDIVAEMGNDRPANDTPNGVPTASIVRIWDDGLVSDFDATKILHRSQTIDGAIAWAKARGYNIFFQD